MLHGLVIHSSSRTQKCILRVARWIRVVCSQCWNVGWTLLASHSSFSLRWWYQLSGVAYRRQSSQDAAFCETWYKPLEAHQGQATMATRQSCPERSANQIGQGLSEHRWSRYKGAQPWPVFCLLYMFGFTVKGEKVGETGYNRTQARDLLKQQVKIVSEVVSEPGQSVQSSKLNKFAKQILRVLVSCRLMSSAEDENVAEEVVSYGNSLTGDTAGALEHWLSELSPMLWCFSFAFSFCLECGDFHGAWWRRFRTRSHEWFGGWVSIRTFDFTVWHEWKITGTPLSQCFPWTHVQGWRRHSLDVFTLFWMVPRWKRCSWRKEYTSVAWWDNRLRKW